MYSPICHPERQLRWSELLILVRRISDLEPFANLGFGKGGILSEVLRLWSLSEVFEVCGGGV